MPHLNSDFQQFVAREESEKHFFSFSKGLEAILNFRSWFLWSPRKSMCWGQIFLWEEVEGTSTDYIIHFELVINLKVTLAFVSPAGNCLTLQKCPPGLRGMVEERNQTKALNLSLNAAFPIVSKAPSMARVAPDLVSATQLQHVRPESCPYAVSNVSCLAWEPEKGVCIDPTA